MEDLKNQVIALEAYIKEQYNYVIRLILKQRNAMRDLVNVEIHNRFFILKIKTFLKIKILFLIYFVKQWMKIKNTSNNLKVLKV